MASNSKPIPTPCFNPRAREGRDRPPPLRTVAEARFNPRAREGRDRTLTPTGWRSARFNPRAREGRDTLDNA